MTTSTTSADAIEQVRPLSATQARALSRLVTNDADQVRAEIDQYADEQITEATARIKQEWADRSADASSWEDRARTIISRFEASRRRLKREAAEAGVSLQVPSVERYGTSIQARVEDMDRAIKVETDRINAARRTAKTRLRRQELALERSVLEASITAQAQAILDSLPSARDLLALDAASDVRAVTSS